MIDLARSVLTRLGAAEAEAALTAEGLVRADLRGIPSHGVNFLMKIIDRVENGVLNLPTNVTLISRSGSTAHFDGGNGLGQPAAHRAMETSIEMARQNGVGLSLIRNTNHIGLLALYTLLAAREGMIGVCMCNAAVSMAPTGGAEALMGTNPLSLAVPCGDDAPILVDMSTSIVARGKIRRALSMEKAIPEGWALDENGCSTTDPGAAMQGSLLPIAGPKGYALALFIDLIAGMLSGSKYGKEILTFHKPLGPTGVGVMALAVDISRFMPLDHFKQLAVSHAETIRNSRKAQNVERIYLPGEIEFEKEKASREYGVEIDPHVARELNQLIDKFGIPMARIEE